MQKVKFSLSMLFVLLLLAFNAFAAKIDSANYKHTVAVSSGSEALSSSSYKTSTVIGIINGIINSTSYINKLGFFHMLLLADGQPCTSANQCEGGFCCSNSCKSSSCPTEEAPSGGGGGAAAAGGGGGGPLPTPIEEKEPEIKDFSVSTSSIKEHIALGAAKTERFTVKNTGSTVFDFDLNVVTVNDFVFLSDSSFSLDAGEEKVIEANIIGKRLGSYFGEIEVIGDGIKKSVNVIVEVESEQVLFDVKIDIPSAYKEVKPGDEIKAQITLLNVGPARKVDVTTTYLIKDKRGTLIYESSETFAVEQQTSFVKSFKIPEDMQPGDYLMVVEVRYENSFAVSSELFSVVEKETIFGKTTKTLKSKSIFAYAFIVFIGLMFLFLYLMLPKIKIFGQKDVKKCYKIINEAQKALDKNDIAQAKELYKEAKKIYVAIEGGGKKEIYNKLMSLYKKLM